MNVKYAKLRRKSLENVVILFWKIVLFLNLFANCENLRERLSYVYTCIYVGHAAECSVWDQRVFERQKQWLRRECESPGLRVRDARGAETDSVSPARSPLAIVRLSLLPASSLSLLSYVEKKNNGGKSDILNTLSVLSPRLSQHLTFPLFIVCSGCRFPRSLSF